MYNKKEKMAAVLDVECFFPLCVDARVYVCVRLCVRVCVAKVL